MAMLISIAVGMLIMSCINFVEFVFVGQGWSFVLAVWRSHAWKLSRKGWHALILCLDRIGILSSLNLRSYNPFVGFHTRCLGFDRKNKPDSTCCKWCDCNAYVQAKLASGCLPSHGFSGSLTYALIAVPDLRDRYTTFVDRLPIVGHSIFNKMWAAIAGSFFHFASFGHGSGQLSTVVPNNFR